MSRVPLLTAESASGDAIRALASPNGHMNVFRVLAHAETCIIPMMKLGQSILTRQQLSARARELLLLVTLSMERGEYELQQHIEIALGAGASQEEVDAAIQGDLTNSIFSGADRALFAFGRQVVESARVEAKVFEAVRVNFSAREIVEAIVAIGFYSTLARLTGALEVELDAAQGMAVLNAAAALSAK